MARYGAIRDDILQGGGQIAIASTWWRDLNKSRSFGDSEDWFKDGLRKVVGDGCETSFWHDIWAGQVTLATHFERMFQISNFKNHTIAEMGSWCNGSWSWNFNWRRSLFVWEENLVLELLEQINFFVENIERKDQWIWSADPTGVFSSKSTFKLLQNRLSEPLDHSAITNQHFFRRFWSALVPHKILVFAWQMLLDRIPTRSNLLRRNIFVEVQLCPFCLQAL